MRPPLWCLCRREKPSQLVIRLVRTFFLKVVSGGNRCRALDPRGIARPDGGGVMVAPDTAFFPPQDHGWAGDLSLALEVRGIHVEVDAERSPVILAHSVDGLGVLDASDIFGHRARIEETGALRGLRKLAADEKFRIRADHCLGHWTG